MNDLAKTNVKTIIRMIQAMRSAFPGEELCVVLPHDILRQVFECEYYDGMSMTIYGLPVFTGTTVSVGLRAEIVS